MAPTTDPKRLEAGRELVIRYLEEAHATEAALVSTLSAHLSMTPPGGYRELLERHLGETGRHAQAIERRMSELGAHRNPVDAAAGLARTVVGQALALAKGPVDLLRGSSREEKLLKNAKDECATEALEIATYDALETAANAVGDERTAQLARTHRAQEERMLEGLRRAIPALTEAAVVAHAGGQPRYDLAPAGAPAAAEADDDLPIGRYDDLTASEIVSRLNRLSQAELRVVSAYEAANRNRRTVLARIDALKDEQPFAGYDELNAEDVIARLRDADGRLASRVRDYEGAHQRRVSVLEAAQGRIAKR